MLADSLSVDFLQNNGEKLKFYTGSIVYRHRKLCCIRVFITLCGYHTMYAGIPEWCVFKGLYDLVETALTDSPKLSKFTMVLMFFMKIRLLQIDLMFIDPEIFIVS